MKFNKWTVGLAAVGVVSLASAARADEKMSQLQTALSNTTISGYVDTSAMWSVGGRGNFGTPLYTPGGVASDGFNLNAVDIAIDKPMDEGPWASGYHVELMLGPDAVGAGGIRQAYLTLRTPVGNGIDWKVGVFDTIIGYESSSDPLNPNYTRSYGYDIEPTTHTGILGTYKVSDTISVSAGVADTYNSVNGRALHDTEKTYLGSVTLTAPDSWGWVKGSTLNLGIVEAIGSSTFGAPSAGGITSYYAGVTIPTPNTALKTGAAFDYRDNHAGGSAWDAGLYATYQATDKLSLNGRVEYLQDNDTGGVAGVGYAAFAGEDTAAEEVTLTAQYNLWANVISRVEFRWDHADHGSPFASSSGTFDHDNAYLLALNLIYQF